MFLLYQQHLTTKSVEFLHNNMGLQLKELQALVKSTGKPKTERKTKIKTIEERILERQRSRKQQKSNSPPRKQWQILSNVTILETWSLLKAFNFRRRLELYITVNFSQFELWA